MNTHTTSQKAKTRHLLFLLVFCSLRTCAGVAGPCKHSVTEDHLLRLRRLIGNQLQNGCFITYNFTERHNLSEACYVKAAFPHILELLKTHLRYGRDSDNDHYTTSLKKLIYNIYSQKCVLQINEEIENSPVRVYRTLPKEALEKVEAVLNMYKNLVTKNDSPMEWNCGEEYANYLESTTVFPTQTSAISPSKPSMAPAWWSQPAEASTPEPVDKYGETHSDETDTAPTSLDPNPSAGIHTITELFREESYSSRNEDFSNIILSTTPYLMKGISDSLSGSESAPASAVAFHNTPFSELQRITQARTGPVPRATPSQRSHENVTPLRPERRTSLIMADASLDTTGQGMLTNFLTTSSQSWSKSYSAGIPKKDSHTDTPPTPLLNTSPHVEQSVDVSPQTQFQSLASLTESVIKTTGKATDEEEKSI